MRGKLALSAFGALLLVVASVAVAPASRPHRSRSNHHSVQVLHLVAKAAQGQFFDVGPSGSSQGDTFVFTNDLLQGNRKVGEDGGTCTVTRVDPNGAATFQCLGTNSLPGGHITVQGLTMSDTDREVLAITGGTGRYRRAHGEVRFKEVSDMELRLTFLVPR
jgi:hypothetical protein